MENHPIPQDVTGFQFKLIGNMTIKQFAYLALCAVTSWIFLQLPILFILKFPVALFFALLGIGLAFVPFEGRPLDQMIGHFFKALLNPTQFVYQKTGGQLYIPNTLGPIYSKKSQKIISQTSQDEKLKIYLRSMHHAPKDRLDEREAKFIASLSNLGDSSPRPTLQIRRPYSPIQIINASISRRSSPPKPIENKPIIHIDKIYSQLQNAEEKEKKQEQAKPAQEDEKTSIKKALEKAREEEKKLEEKSTPTPINQDKVTELEKKLQEVVDQKESLIQRLISLEQKVQSQGKNIFTPGTYTQKPEARHIKQVPLKAMSKNVGLPMAPTSPNIITGIVKDPRGNTLSNILVEVKDKEGNPVRAFKTNELGRFISATPLANGTYVVEFEDPKSQNKFEKIEINVRGDIIMPIEATSVDTREELRKSLFSSN